MQDLLNDFDEEETTVVRLIPENDLDYQNPDIEDRNASLALHMMHIITPESVEDWGALPEEQSLFLHERLISDDLPFIDVEFVTEETSELCDIMAMILGLEDTDILVTVEEADIIWEDLLPI